MQFKLKSILILVMVLAVLSAVCAPFVRELTAEQLLRVGVLVVAAPMGLGVVLSLAVFFRRRPWGLLGTRLILLRRPSLWSGKVLFWFVGVLLLGGMLLATLSIVVRLSLRKDVPFPTGDLFHQAVVSFSIGIAVLILWDSVFAIGIYEHGVRIEGSVYTWRQIREVSWNSTSGDLSIVAHGVKRVKAKVPLEARANVQSWLEENCLEEVLTIVNSQSR